MPSFNQNQQTLQLDDYRAFTTTLTATLARDVRVTGLIALGSMAEQDSAPDRRLGKFAAPYKDSYASRGY